MKISENSKQDIDALKARFIDDLKYPITVFEEPYWSFYLNLYELEKKSCQSWVRLCFMIEEEYDGKIKPFLEDFYACREALIQSLQTCSAYEKYNSMELPSVDKSFFGNNIKKNDIYNEGYVGGTYISIDLKKANVQAFNYVSPEFFGQKIDDDHTVDQVYEAWIKKHTEGKKTLSWYVPQSKYIRQVIFGNCNPKRQIRIEESLVCEAGKLVIGWLKKGHEVVEIGSDEMVLKVPELELDEKNYKKLEETILHVLGVQVKIEPYKLSSLEFQTGNGHTLRVYKKNHIREGKGPEYKGIHKHYHAQIYESIHNIPVSPEEYDLVFYQEKEPAKFINRIKFIGENNG